jgi:hypothetical protein
MEVTGQPHAASSVPGKESTAGLHNEQEAALQPVWTVREDKKISTRLGFESRIVQPVKLQIN